MDDISPTFAWCEPAFICVENRITLADWPFLVFSGIHQSCYNCWNPILLLLNLFLTVWSEKCTRVVHWRSFSRALIVFLCSSSHKGVDTSIAAGLMPFCCSVELFLCNGVFLYVLQTLETVPGETANLLVTHHLDALLEELDYLSNLDELKVPSHANSSTKDTNKKQI